MTKLNRRQLLGTGLVAGTLTAVSAAKIKADPAPVSIAQAGGMAGYDRQTSGLLVRACGLAVEQYAYSLDSNGYDGSLQVLPSYGTPFDRYQQVASFKAAEFRLSDADPDSNPINPATVATKSVEVAIGIKEVFFGYLLTSDSHHLLALRGTQTDSEWINNVSSRQSNFRTREPQYGQVHRGFQTVYEKVITQIKRSIASLNLSLPFYVTGHSLGGAVAMLTAADLALDNPALKNQLQVYTYGSPRVGNSTFVQMYNGLLPRTFRIVNLADSVPITPPESFRGDNFLHAGQEWSYLSQLGSVGKNHAIETYTAAIDQNVETNQSRSYPTSAIC